MSDTHLSASALQAQANWDAVVGNVGACAPDLVIHLGDLSLDGARNATDLRHGRGQLDRPPYRFWPPPARDRLDRLFGGTPPALVMSGHVHQYRLLRLDGIDHLWAPTTRAVLPDHAQPVLGAKRCGIVSLTLTTATPAEQELIEPDGLEQLTLTVDLPDPHHR